MTAATQHTASSQDGTTIAYEQRGDGPPLVLVGGAFQYRAIDRETTRLAELLAERFTVVHYDRRGRGESGDTPPYAVAREIEDVAAVIAAVAGGGDAFVYGMSSGAVLALEAAASGLPIARLALYEPPFSPDGGSEGSAAELISQLRAYAEAGERDAAVALFMGGAGLPDEALAQMRADPSWADLESAAHTLWYDCTIMGDGAVPAERLAPVEIPLLALDGGASPPWAAAAVQALAAALPQTRRETLPGQTHEVSPDALAPALLAFFSEER